MERYFVGLDVSKDETAICVKGSDGRTALALKKPTDPDAIATALLRTNCKHPRRAVVRPP